MQGLASNKHTTSFSSRQCRGWHQANIQHHSEPTVQGLASNKQTTSFIAVSARAGIKQTSFRAASAGAGIKETSFRAASAGTGIKQSVDISQSRQCRGWHQTNRQHHSEPLVQGLASNKHTTSFIAFRLLSNKQTTSFRAVSAGAGIKQTYIIIQSRQCRGWQQTNRQHHSEPSVQGLASNKQTTSFRASVQGLASNKQTTSFRAVSARVGIKQTYNNIQSRQCRGWH